jgi:hypothetical protein
MAPAAPQLLVRMKELGLPLLQGLSMRAEATQFQISGRVHLGIQLTHEAPGIKGIYYVSRAAGAGSWGAGHPASVPLAPCTLPLWVPPPTAPLPAR